MSVRHSKVAVATAFALCVQAAGAQQPVASVPTDGVQLRNVLSVANGRAAIANNGEVTAVGKTAEVALARGGSLLVCTSTTMHIAQDKAVDAARADEGLMFSLDRGAFETDYRPATYSDVVLTPDLRLIISGPGMARLKIRVNEQGDTCVDNAGDDAPYVVVSSLTDGGVYRVRAGQRVLFVGGSLNRVVDAESEPCGCPAPEPGAIAAGGKQAGDPSSTRADLAFPTAVSEGGAPPSPPPSTPAVPEGQVHAEVQATLSSNAPLGPPPPPLAAPASPAVAPLSKPARKPGFFGRIGHFFARVFGAD